MWHISGAAQILVSSLPLQTLQHLSLSAICSDSAQLSSGHGSLGTTRCMVLSCYRHTHTVQISSVPSPLCCPSLPHLPPFICKGPECNYEGNYSSIVFPLPRSLLLPPACSLQTNYSLVNSSFLPNYSWKVKKKKKKKSKRCLLLSSHYSQRFTS